LLLIGDWKSMLLKAKGKTLDNDGDQEWYNTAYLETVKNLARGVGVMVKDDVSNSSFFGEKDDANVADFYDLKTPAGVEKFVKVLMDYNLEAYYPNAIFQHRLAQFLSEDTDDVARLEQFLTANMPESKENPIVDRLQTVHIIAYSLFDYICSRSTFMFKDDIELVKNEELPLFRKFVRVLHPYTKDSAEKQLRIIYALQVFANDHDFPKGFIARGFMYLLKLVPVDATVFLEWKMDINDSYPGKGKALFEVNTFLNAVDEMLQDDDSEEESEEEA